MHSIYDAFIVNILNRNHLAGVFPILQPQFHKYLIPISVIHIEVIK